MALDISRFLRRFHAGNETVNEVFTQGCCFWFADILCKRFPEHSRLMYDQVANHFVAEIDGRLYDITGDVTDTYKVEPWDELEDDLLRSRIIRDCIMF